MHVTVLIAGIADPKRPLEKPASGNWADLASTPTTPFKLSPFDEAALEIALKLRDKNPATFISALITDGACDIALMRAVASYRLDQVVGLCVPATERGNPAWLAAHALSAVQVPDKPIDLILIGREHGDLDDGMAPAYLAESWGWPFVSLAQHAGEGENGTLIFERTGTRQDESISLLAPACASISNNKNNRLRHPLMKNVMLAKQQKFQAITPEASIKKPGITIVRAAPPETSARGETPCRMLEGTVNEQARELASFLKSRQNLS
ncbi:MAG TPA: hypothetical protein VIP51_12725 [Eoetvoesiella sp.]